MDITISLYLFFTTNWWLLLVLGLLLIGGFVAAMILLPQKRRLIKRIWFYTIMGILFLFSLYLFFLLNCHFLAFVPVYGTLLIALYGTSKFFIQNPKVQQRINLAGLYVIMGHLAVFLFFPFLFMFFKSFMDINEAIRGVFIPSAWHPENYSALFGAEVNIFRGFLNTLCVILFATTGTVVSSCMCAYGFARGKFRGKGVWFSVMMATIMLPGVVTQVPLYIMFDQIFHMNNTWLPLVVPAFFGGGAMNIFLANQFVRGISRELDEAAKIDGAGRMRIFFQIILPLLKPIMIYMIINCVMAYWRDFDGALIYITRDAEEWQTLALAIYYGTSIEGADLAFPNYQMASGIIMTIPMIVVFFLFQRQMVDGVVMSGIKG